MITEDTSLIESRKLAPTMSSSELDENARYLHRRRDEMIEKFEGRGDEAAETSLRQVLRDIDLKLTMISIAINLRRPKAGSIGSADNVTHLPFGRLRH